VSDPTAKAIDFESRKAYQSKHRPSYTAWVSFFRDEQGRWYLTCEEVTRPDKPLPKCSREQWYRENLPVGYDKSQYLMEMVILRSTDDMKTWEVISREPARFQHSAGTYANQIRTRDGRFLRFVWAPYSLDPSVKPNEIFWESDDDGKTWKKMPDFVDPNHFHYFPNRLRMLRDGTLVIFIPHWPRVELGTERPTRGTTRLDVMGETSAMLFFSHDQGRSWSGPLPIYNAMTVSETDFVELPNGDLLFINNSIFAHPGRQIVYRNGNRFTPGPYEPVKFLGADALVPETVCLTDDGILIGCMRCSEYMWSDDLGESWWRIQDIPVLEGGMDNPQRMECYQPTIEYVGDGLVACAGHYGGDDALFSVDEYLNIHLFRLEVLSKPRKAPRILVSRDFDEAADRWLNAYTITLTCEGVPLPDKEIEFWYAERYQPGYEDFPNHSLEERIQMGGKLLKARTDSNGAAHVSLPEMEEVTYIHLSYQFVVRFNADRSDPEYRPVETLQHQFYAVFRQDPPLESQAQ
jgi:hypothetical protein